MLNNKAYKFLFVLDEFANFQTLIYNFNVSTIPQHFRRTNTRALQKSYNLVRQFAMWGIIIVTITQPTTANGYGDTQIYKYVCMYVFALMCGTAVNAVSMAHLSAKRGRIHIHIHKFSYICIYVCLCVLVLLCSCAEVCARVVSNIAFHK